MTGMIPDRSYQGGESNVITRTPTSVLPYRSYQGASAMEYQFYDDQTIRKSCTARSIALTRGESNDTAMPSCNDRIDSV